MLWMTDSPGEPKKAKQNEARIVDKKNTITRRCQNPVVYLKAALFLNPTLVSRFLDSLLADHFHKNLTFFFVCLFFSGATVILPRKTILGYRLSSVTIVTRCRTKKKQSCIIGKSKKNAG